MKYKRRIIVSVVWLVLGAALFFCSFFNVVDDFWSGMGAGLFAVGAVQLVKQIKYRTNEEYREKVDITEKDERIKFISGQAHAWAAYVYVIAAAVATIGFKLAGYDDLSLFASVSLCFMVLTYAVAFLILSKKY